MSSMHGAASLLSRENARESHRAGPLRAVGPANRVGV